MPNSCPTPRPSWISADWVRQQQASNPTHVFDRLIRGLWTSGHGRLLTGEEIRGIFGQIPEGAEAWVVGVDLALTRDRAAIVLLRLAPGGIIVIESILLWVPRRGEPVPIRAWYPVGRQTGRAFIYR